MVFPLPRCSRQVRLSCFATIPDKKANGSFSSPGQRAAPSRHMLLGRAVTDVSLSVRLFPQSQPPFSLRQSGCPGKEDFAPCGLLHQAVETSSGKQQPHPTDPNLISQRMLCFPRGDARAKRLSLYAAFSHLAANPRLMQAGTPASGTDSDFSANAVLSQRLWT